MLFLIVTPDTFPEVWKEQMCLPLGSGRTLWLQPPPESMQTLFSNFTFATVLSSAGHASDWTARRAGLWEANLTDLWARAGGATAQITDVGNIILGHPNAMLHAATKVWAASELTASAEFFYNFTFSNREVPDNAGSLLFFSPEGNPATVFGGVEVALMTRWHAMIINKGVSHVVYEDLDIRYTGGDGML
eukprot:SAG25_NODE_125_length_14598_cov_7.819611_2_plen_190_part_00